MSYLNYLIRRVVQTAGLGTCMLCVVTQAGCSSPTDRLVDRFNDLPHVDAPPDLRVCAEVVDGYVATSRRWPEAEYKVAVETRRPEPLLVLFRVSHVADIRPNTVGGGRSFFVEVDCRSGEIVRDLKSQ